jgi:hypothetical protein
MTEREDETYQEPSGDSPETAVQWVVVGETESRTLAEFAVDGLKSYEIPAVLDSRPGVLGTAGLPMRSIRDGHLEAFKIMVPDQYAEEAAGLVTMFLGGGEGIPDDELPDDDEEEG